jgi:hypothetical protein
VAAELAASAVSATPTTTINALNFILPPSERSVVTRGSLPSALR